MKVIVTPEAEMDIAMAQQWYERERTGLGKQFRAEIGHSIERIQTIPAVISKLSTDTPRIAEPVSIGACIYLHAGK